MRSLENEKVGSIVASNFRTSSVLTSHNIDFCCGGGVTLAEACQNKNADLEAVIAELEQMFKEKDAYDYKALPLDELVETIVKEHHKYVEKTVPVLRAYLDKLCNVHGERHPELQEIRELFYAGSAALYEHMEKEEFILFPFVKEMVSAKNERTTFALPHFGHIQNPIACMEHEHENEGQRFRQIAELSNGYQSPEDGCQTYWVAFQMLKEFEEDLHKHIHLENNILFPAAQAMYEEMIS